MKEMYLADSTTTTVNLEAANALLLAGLERAIELARLKAVHGSHAATLSLRSAGSGVAHPCLDIEVDSDRIVVSLARQPSEPTWEAIYNLLEHLMKGFVTDCNE